MSADEAKYSRPRMKSLKEYEETAGAWHEILAGGLESDLKWLQPRVPRLRNLPFDELREQQLTREETLNLLAQEHGYELWSEFRTTAVAIERDSLEEPMVAACAAIENGDIETLREIHESDPALIHVSGTGGETLLHRALWGLDHGDWSWLPGPCNDPNRFTIVEQLLDWGAPAHRSNHRGWTPLHTAGYIGHTQAIERLLALGANPDCETQGRGGTPQVLALFWGHTEAARLLDGELANLRVAAGLGDLDKIEHAVRAGVDAATQQVEFYRPHEGFPRDTTERSSQFVLDDALVYACRNDQAAVLDRLLALGANPNATVAGATPLAAAACHGSNHSIAWLCRNGVDLDGRANLGASPDATPLHLAAWYDHLETVQLLVNSGARYDVRDSQWDGTAVSWAKFHGNDDVASFLIEDGKLDLRDAISSGHVEHVRKRIRANPTEVTQTDKDGNTALHYAAYADEVEIIRLLLENGARADVANKDGATPADAAQEAQSEGALAVFKENS